MHIRLHKFFTENVSHKRSQRNVKYLDRLVTLATYGSIVFFMRIRRLFAALFFSINKILNIVMWIFYCSDFAGSKPA